MRKSIFSTMILSVMMFSACNALPQVQSVLPTETSSSLLTDPSVQNGGFERPDILRKWVINETKPLEAKYYGIQNQGGNRYWLPFSFPLGEVGGQMEFTQNAMIYNAVAYDYEWVDNQRIKLSVNIGLIGPVWLVYGLELEDSRLSLLDDRDGSVLVVLSDLATATSMPTSAIAPTSTESLTNEFQFGEIVALDYSTADWQPQGSALEHQSLAGCVVVAPGGGDFPTGLPKTTIAGFTWLKASSSYLLQIGDEIVGEIDVESNSTDCRTAAETLLKSLHAARAYAQAGECANAPMQHLKVGDTAVVVSRSYLRTEPRWADDTRIRQVGSDEEVEIEITGGPICGIYDKGEYSYWQVELSSGEKGWMAEGDLNQYYLTLK